MSVKIELIRAWEAMQGQFALKPIRSEEDYRKMVDLANEIADEMQGEADPLYSLFDLVTELIDVWEQKHVKIPKAEPHQVLRFLLETHGLQQNSLADIASPSLVSDILSGRRAISRKVAVALAKRFSIDASVFL